MKNNNIFNLIIILLIIVSLGFVFAQDHSAGKVPSSAINQSVIQNDNSKGNAIYKTLGIQAVLAYGFSNVNSNTLTIGIPDGTLTPLAVWAPGGFAGSACKGGNGNYYIIEHTLEFSQLDPVTGAVTSLGFITGLGSDIPSGIAYNPANGMYYLAAGIIGLSDNIYSLDINTLIATLIGGTGTGGLQIDFCISGNGTCYSYDLITDNGYTIDLSTGVATLLGTLGYEVNFGQGMSYDRQTNTIYLSAFNASTFTAQLRTMDPVTGMTTLLVDWGFEQIAPFALDNPYSAAISGYALDGDGNAVPGVDVAFSNGGATVTTDVNGRYVTSVSAGWNGTSTASMAGWTFVPTGYDYSTPVYSNQMNQDFTATQLPLSLFINGNVRDGNGVGIEGVAVSLSNGGATVYTNAAGYYTTSVAYGWNGTATPTMDRMWFSPSSMDYPPVLVHQMDQNYLGGQNSLLMTGFVRDGDGVGIDGVAVTFSNGGATVYTDVTGEYAGSVAYGWNGTATPSKPDYAFWPIQHIYFLHLTSDQLGQDFTAMMVDPNASIQTSILPAYPNPFNPSTTITYGLDNDGKVSINIYDISGRLIKNLVKTDQAQGLHSIIWNGTNQNGEKVPAGMYLSILESGNDVKTTKLMLLK
jgi:hypothetical protein